MSNDNRLILTLTNRKKVEGAIDGIGSAIDRFLNPKETLSATIDKIIEKIKNMPTPSFENAIAAAKQGGKKIKESFEKGKNSVITDISDFLGFDDQSIGKIRQKMVEIAKDTNVERTKNKKVFNTKSDVDEKIKEYNQYLQEMKSEDENVSQAATNGMNDFLEKLKETNSELNQYILKRREAAEATTPEGEEVEYEALSSDAVMDAQRETIQSLFNDNGIRETIDQFRALGSVTGELTDEQRVMIAGLRDIDANFANFLEQHPAATMGQYARAQAVATLKTMALEAATAALNAAISFGLSIAFQALTTGIMSVINRYNDLREANLETMQSFEDTASAIDDYKEKIEELYKVMNDESSTTNEVYDAKSDLLDIQRELTDTYGDQAKSIDLVNGKLEEEIKDLDELERLEAAKAFHKMSKDSYEHDKRSLEKKHNGSGSIDKYGVGISLSAFADDSQFKKQAEELEKKILSLGYKYAGDEASTKAYTLTQVTDEEAIEKINELMSYIETNISTSSDIYNLRDNLAKKLERLDTEDFQNKKSNVEAYALQNILSSEKYRPLYKGLQAAAADYDEALKSGDEALAKSSIERINELKGKIADLKIDDKYIKEQFSSTLKQIQNDLNKNELKVYIETAPKYTYSPVFGISENGARGGYSPLEYFKNAFEGYSDIDVENIGVSGGSEKEVKAYNMLEKAANYYEMEVEDVIDVLVELGIIFSRDADAAKYTTTNFSSMLEEVEKTTEGLDKFVSAQQKVATGSALTADEVNELIKLDGSLASSVERTANGYVISSEKLAEARAKYINEQKESLKEDIAASERQLKSVQYELAINQKIVDELGSKSNLTDDEKRKLNDAKAIVENRLEDEKATTEQLEQQKLLLGQIISPLEDYAAMFKDVADKAENVTDKLAQMRSGQYKTGVIDPADVLDFINEVPDWQNYIEINDGKATLKKTSDEALKEQIKQTSGYYDVSEKLNDKLKERGELQKKINGFKANNVINSPGDVKMLEDMNEELDILNGTIDISEKDFQALTAILDVFFGKIEKKPAITDFEDEISKLNHKKSLGMSEDAWAGEYATIANNYYNDIKALADKGDTDALSKLWEIDEQLYQNNIDKTQRAFDDKKLIIDNAREDLQKSVLEYRDAYAALNEEYYAPGTALGNTEDGKKQYAANLREIEKLNSEAYDNITSRFQSAIDFGKIIDPNIINDLADVFKGQELPDAVAQVIQKGIETGIWNATDLATIAPYLSEALLAGSEVNAEAYQNAIAQQKDYVISAFEDEKTQLENQLEAGLISSSQFIDGLTELWETHYKDKKEFAEEDLQTQKDILEAHKSEIQKQIDALEAYSENQTEPYQNEIDALNDVKDAYDDLMDDRIDALEEEKKAIEKKNEEQEEANDLQEKWLNLQKASMNKRLVYTGNGGWQLKRDEEEYNNAKKEYDEAKKEDATAKIDEAIEKLEEEKEARDKAIDKDIEAREDAIKRIQKPIDDLTKVLTLLVTEQQNIDPEFIAQLLKTESADEALALINKKNSFGQEQEAKYGVDANYDQLTTETINKLAKEAEKRNQTLDEYTKSLGLNLSEAVTTSTSAQPETQDNTKSTDANTEALNKNTEAVEKAAATTTDTTAAATETNKNFDANSYLIDSNGKQILNDDKPIKALTHDEWAKRHKVSEWATPGRSVNENMTMEQYEQLKKGQKNKIIPASIVDITDITDAQLKQFLEAIQSNTKITPQNVSPATTATTATAAEAINQNVTNAPIINQTITIEGSADKKTIAEFKTVMDDKLVECMNYLGTSMNNAFMRQINKS